MKRHELEKMLLDPEGFEKLSEFAKELRETHRNIRDAPKQSASLVNPVEIRPYEVRSTANEIQDNDRNFVVRSATSINVARFLTERREADPLSLVKLTTKMCKDEPSAANQLYLEIAINQLISDQTLDEKGGKIVNEAIQVLISSDVSVKKEG